MLCFFPRAFSRTVTQCDSGHCHPTWCCEAVLVRTLDAATVLYICRCQNAQTRPRGGKYHLWGKVQSKQLREQRSEAVSCQAQRGQPRPQLEESLPACLLNQLIMLLQRLLCFEPKKSEAYDCSKCVICEINSQITISGIFLLPPWHFFFFFENAQWNHPVAAEHPKLATEWWCQWHRRCCSSLLPP